MGEGSEGIAASSGGTREAHHVDFSPQEDRSGAAEKVGEGTGGEEEGGLRVDSMKSTKLDWKTQRFFRMWPRALFHMKEGAKVLNASLSKPGVYILYRNDEPYYIGKTGKPLIKRLRTHALKPNARRYNFWNYFSAFEISNSSHRDEVEAILISAMPTAANGSRPKIPRMPLDRAAAKLLNNVQALMLTGRGDTSGESKPEEMADEDDI
jgi:GIY-YIG catalytic domain